ncbi:glucose 1-dehydrogenase [Denitratisoma oestradiolicum]|uniref:2,5-dichloro-2,5-cyclohexadiene-1,4-diol dehydrogenase n=1 Tax=Denitratisoma oestradiolicum TaxID=311182 RepID=A0A6S6Y3I0_9PROT|nr:glucose 1-dehydrogenase [Denitratisoma oestradiolicum]TWO80038.1 short chain dehydrogenase [Denitratisoma oestradiolicum]CAB1369808.1 2,5-dichloro-2,5-cyclohexadiene-1,4-diol dehydrogenase [Denitratisoma oestradiolicum]
MAGLLFEGKAALVTGAGGGIGRAAAIAFAKEGASVMVADVNAAGCEETVGLIRAAGGKAEFMLCNVTKEEEVAALVAGTVAKFGRLDSAFNNAGISTSRPEINMDDFRRVIDINLMGVAYGLKYQIEHMIAHGGGTIVNTASIAGLTGSGTLEYCASKHAVVGMTRSGALRYAKQGVRVNAVCPGVIETPMTAPLIKDPAMKAHLDTMCPIGRMGKAEEIAEAVIWLCSAKSSFVTGQALAVDGGFMCS